METEPKPQSQVLLASKSGDPLLVCGRYGRGRTVAFTSDVQSRWAAAWLRWPGFGPFWTRLVRQTMRKEPPHDCLLQVEPGAASALVTLDALDHDGRFLDGAEATLHVTDPGGQERALPMEQVAPGRYAARVATPSPGAYFLETKLRSQGRLVDAQRRAIVPGFADEFRIQPVDTALLQKIADSSGGRWDPQPAELFISAGRTVPETVLSWRELLTAAAVLFLIDLLLKRLEWRAR